MILSQKYIKILKKMKKLQYILLAIISISGSMFTENPPVAAMDNSSNHINKAALHQILVAADENLYFGESFYADKKEYHATIKDRILTAVGATNYSKKVGTNPNITVVKKKIVLAGQGDFKGKSFPTELAAGDYLLK
jgi:hypothetical protein